MRFSRLALLVGEKTIRDLQSKTVMIAGLGGVGSFALEALARAGIGNFLLFDHDHIDVSNINRQNLAMDSTVGMLKVEVASRRLHDINPGVNVSSYPVFLDASNIDYFLDFKIDYLVDAIDSVESKIFLIEKAMEKHIPMVSSMGFAKKVHPEMIKIGLLKNTSVCPLAKKIRLRFKDNKTIANLEVVFSTEQPLEPLIEDGKLGSISTVPPVAGMMMASVVLNHFIALSKEKNS